MAMHFDIDDFDAAIGPRTPFRRCPRPPGALRRHGHAAAAAGSDEMAYAANRRVEIVYLK